ncbi:hypothetical protein [Wenzhouxiangella sediminis]|uniref:hypothetical protein n=1 Tax=Wenzhouxiangella sediminis TaxID=1792836 RepID=UPI0015F27F04|nr:hypothetical protein [Wenzhouxiangella sediminis]
MKVLRWFLAWVTAVFVTASIGSVIQTQINLARITGLGVDVSVAERLVTTGQDLLGFAPLWGVIVAAGLLVALLVASGLARRWPIWSVSLHVLAGFFAPLVALLVMDAMLPVTVVAAARTWGGLMMMSLPGAFGGWLYVVLLQRQKGQTFHQAAQRNSSSQAGS